MTTMFQPKGEKSRRLMLIDLVDASQPGDMLTYEDLGVLLDVDSRHDVQSAVNQAKASVEKSTRRALVAERNVGYRVITAGEHYERAVAHQKKGYRQIQRALSKVENVRVGELSVEQRAMATAAVTALRLQADFERRADLKYARAEELRELVERQSAAEDRTGVEVEALKARLERLERLL